MARMGLLALFNVWLILKRQRRSLGKQDEQDGHQDTINLLLGPGPGQEFFDLVEQGVLIDDKGQMIFAFKLDVTGSLNERSDIAPAFNRQEDVSRPVDDQP